jgi:hypothetical protein
MDSTSSVTYLSYLVFDLRWSQWVLSGEHLRLASVASDRIVHQSRKSLSGCKHSVSVPSVPLPCTNLPNSRQLMFTLTLSALEEERLKPTQLPSLGRRSLANLQLPLRLHLLLLLPP